jgi:hypothetical protein
MILNVPERIVLSQILPVTGSFLNLKLVREIKEELSFTQSEHEEIQFKQNGDQITWEKDKEKEFEFNRVIYDLVVNSLKELDKQEKLEERHVSLYEKFVLDK